MPSFSHAILTSRKNKKRRNVSVLCTPSFAIFVHQIMLEKLETSSLCSRTLISLTPARLSDRRSMESSVHSHQRVSRYESGLMTVLLRLSIEFVLIDSNMLIIFVMQA